MTTSIEVKSGPTKGEFTQEQAVRLGTVTTHNSVTVCSLHCFAVITKVFSVDEY